ncbi:MAG: hypothetical protein KAY37_00645, partial [Phycisphaerae bacterium]|nr:hypothetical protein [Phycisphaerae bacterium]
VRSISSGARLGRSLALPAGSISSEARLGRSLALPISMWPHGDTHVESGYDKEKVMATPPTEAAPSRQ